MRTFRNISFAIFLLTFVVAHRANVRAMDGFCENFNAFNSWATGEADCYCSSVSDNNHEIFCYGLFGGCSSFCSDMENNICPIGAYFTCNYSSQEGCDAICDFSQVYN